MSEPCSLLVGAKASALNAADARRWPKGTAVDGPLGARARRADLGDAADAVAYAGLFLAHLAAFDRPAPDSCGSFVALACGHNAPWRRKERDALYAWLEVQLPPSS